MNDKGKKGFRCTPAGIALCALLAGAIAPAFGQWEQVPTGTSSYLRDIFFINDSVGFCVGGGDAAGFLDGTTAVVLRTVDGGSTWATVFQDTGVAITQVAAKGDTVVCFGRSMAEPSLLWTSFDSGASWQLDPLSFPEPDRPSFLGDDLFVLSYQDLLRLDLSTHEAQTLFIPNTVSIYGRDKDMLYLMTTEKTVHSSADGGLTWDTIPCFMADSLGIWTESNGEALFASGDTIAIKLTYNAVSTYTTDHGLNWTTYFSPFVAQVLFNSLDTMYGYHKDSQIGVISVSTDRGLSASQQQQLGFRISEMFFMPKTDQGWICGENGMILKTVNGGFATGIPEQTSRAAHITVQPNPAHGEITLVVPDGIHVESIELLDSALKRVRHYNRSASVLNTRGLAAGQYMLQVVTDQGAQSIKVVLQ